MKKKAEKSKQEKRDRNTSGMDIFDRECVVCGKYICVLSPLEWVYKVADGGKQKYCCSWSCMNKYRDSMPQPSRRKQAMIIRKVGKCS